MRYVSITREQYLGFFADFNRLMDLPLSDAETFYGVMMGHEWNTELEPISDDELKFVSAIWSRPLSDDERASLSLPDGMVAYWGMGSIKLND